MCDVPHTMPVRVYYEDTDCGGVVYHASFVRFMERGRTEFVRARGVTQSALRDAAGAPLAFVVRRMAIDFIRPGRMDDLLTVETQVSARGGASVTMAQRILHDGEVLVSAEVVVVLVGSDGRPRRISADLADGLLGPASGPSHSPGIGRGGQPSPA